MRDTWIEVELSDIANIISGKTQKTVVCPNGKYPIYGSAGICGRANSYICEAGATIVGRKGTINSPIYVNERFWNIDTVFGFYPLKPINPRFLYFYCLSFNFKKLDKSTTVPSLAKRDLLKIRFPLSPLPEQRAIVAKIEQLFSELDKGIASFKSAQKKLDIYRQAVLKKAFEGELTKTWRKQQNNLPTADELLQQIKQQRQQHYQQQISDWEKAVKEWEIGGKEGRKPAKPRQKKQILPITEEEKLILYTLPKNWFWEKLGNLSIVSGGLTKNSKRKQLPIKRPFLRVANVYANKLKLFDMHEIGLNNNELKRVELKNKDLLIVEGNGSIEQIGRVAIWRNEIDNCVHQNHLIKSRPFKSISSEYILYFLSSKLGRDFIVTEASSTSGLHTLSLTKVSNLKLPICSLQEQTQIVQEIESRLSVCDQLSKTLKQQLKKAEALRQSILKKAFEGRLLTQAEIQTCQQQPDWEPAEQLLARIKAESTKKTTTKPRKKIRRADKR